MNRIENNPQIREEKFRGMINNIQVGILLQGPQAEIIFSNPKALELLGLTEAQLLSKTSFDPDWNVKHEDGSPFPGEMHPVPQAIATRKPVLNVIMGVYRPVLQDRIWLSVDAIPHINNDGSVKEVVCSFIDITQRKIAEEAVLNNEMRLKRLVEVLQHPSETIQEFLDFALEKAIELTGSKIGYIYHYSEETKKFVLNTWSKDVMAECTVINPSTTYDLEKTGIWGEAVRQRRPIIVNDFHAMNPLKKGLPSGHVGLVRFMTLPVFIGENIVGVVGLANKTVDYNDTDIVQTTLLMDVIWKVTERKKAEERVKLLLAEKELILKEVHHRIKNNMNTIYSLLTLQSGMVKDTSAAIALDDAGRRVQSMMLLYNKLYRSIDVTSLSLSEYFPELIDEIIANFPINNTSIRVEKNIEDFSLDIQHVQVLGILVNELITNIMKYAFIGRKDGLIRVSARLQGKRVFFIVEDNGNGMPKNINFENTTGFGLLLVHGLTMQLQGEIHIERDNGTKIILEFNP